MAMPPLGPGELPFKISGDVNAILAIDAEFWRLHAQWRVLEDEFENHPGYPDECPIAQELLDRASAARDAMFLKSVWTGAALIMKLKAIAEADASCVVGMRLVGSLTVFDVIQADAERIFQREAGLWNPTLAIG